ncbi:CPBP family intramembrane glutamic endopeptidase [Chondrinema litorale]|uniref:CPBP family intramembrane glutamic endopeptidase n=1 Tax=Chondrinema litorale TaxID=2994555 RepID=UPI0025432B8C|nr:CPBP family intramembrane glutamic endopeptidase [Chondrinema litorale]UZR99138.1 CPBP family intramembrane metalloprotease [Chondrinema litorale]
MVGILVILGISWLLLHYLEKENLLVLGFYPIKKSLLQFVIGVGFIFLLKIIFIYLDTQVNSISWRINSPINYFSIFSALWYHLKSALTEDLIFRGVLLYILIKRIGMQKAILVSAVAFGIYHWISYGIIGSSIILLLYVLITTGFTGYVWAYTFAKTKSIMMPLGFHLGWNFITTLFYDSQPYGYLIFQESAKIELLEPYNTYYSIFIGLAPSLLTLIFIKTLIALKQNRGYNIKKNHNNL